MYFILVLAFILDGKTILLSQPSDSIEQCKSFVGEFVAAQPDTPFEAQCIDVIGVLGVGVPKRDA